mgnify:CR=1 FL=1
MIVTNIIEVYFRQKKQKKKVKVRSCFGCIHSRRYDSTGKEVMERRIYCRAWGGIVYVGCARNCELYEPYPPQYSLKKQKGGDVVG